MEIFIIALTAFIASILTFFSGFGLGTILAPVLMIFFPVDLAIALTGVVIYQCWFAGKSTNCSYSGVIRNIRSLHRK